MQRGVTPRQCRFVLFVNGRSETREQTEPEYTTLSLALRGARGQRVLRRYKNNGALSTTILSSNGRETVAVKQCFRRLTRVSRLLYLFLLF